MKILGIFDITISQYLATVFSFCALGGFAAYGIVTCCLHGSFNLMNYWGM